jgi:UDP-GlcNAc:undecaprenyl-phosphate GlcNAc-1-phosphate transferase
LLLGLPLFDTMFVTFKRIYHGISPFSPDKNHVHHQLLALRFDHYEAVIIIYLVQAVFVVAGILMRYQSDSLVVLAWCCANIILAILLTSAGRYRWYVHNRRSKSLPARWMEWDIGFYLGRVSRGIIGTGILLLLIVGPLLTTSVDRDLGIAASILALLLLLRIVYGSRMWIISFRLILYVTAAFVVYLLAEYPPALALIPEAGYVYFGLLAGALVIGAWSSLEDAFEVTPTDFLIILILIGLAFMPGAHIGDEKIIQMAIKLVILFYAIEYLLRNITEKWSRIEFMSLWALAVITFRGLFA